MKDLINKIVNNEELSFEEIQQIVSNIVNKVATEAQIGAFLVAITKKGFSNDELFGFATAIRAFSNRVVLDKYVVDSCGTGADVSMTINISTPSAIIANACGANVLKQTNSAITSACGSTDLLKALDVDITRIPQDAKSVFKKHNIAFVHSPYFNEFARVNNQFCQQIGIKSIFKYLEPLINPSFPNAQLLGVSSYDMCEKTVYALQKLGTDRALVVNGINPNIDEISICSKTVVYELKNNQIKKYEISPEDFGFKTADISEILGKNAIENAEIIKGIFKGEIVDARRNVILMNAGAMIYLAGLVPTMFEGAKIAIEAIEKGLVYDKLLKIQGLAVSCK